MNRGGAPWMSALVAKSWLQSLQLERFLFTSRAIFTGSAPFCSLIISRAISTTSVPFRPSGGAVDIVVVQQREGGLKCSPWYVRFGRFQGLLRRKERVVAIAVNGVETDLRMYLNTKGQVYFLRDGVDEEDSANQTLDTADTTTALANQLQGGGFVRRLYRRRLFVKRRIQTLVPTSQQLESLNLREGKNNVTFTFMTRLFGKRQIDAGIYLFPWNSKIVVSDVDGTITRSDVLGQVMPWLGQDWSQSGVATLFSAIKENGYKLMFLSSRAISQAYRTRKFITELDQNGVKLPDGPVVISPDGIFPSLYREVVRRVPHQFKIACLQEIRSLFPPDYNPFYAGFGNRDTDVVCYLEVGIPKGKIFTINPQGKLVVSTALDVKCYVSLHKLVDEMFPRVQ